LQIEVLRRHIEDIAAKCNIQIVYKEGYPGRAYHRERRIKISPIKSEITYAVALHELGHLLGRRGRARIDKETFAWIWAKQNSLIWTESMNDKMVRCLQSYVMWSKRRKGAVVPQKGHAIFSLIGSPD
jgi:hypothetical protein